MRLLTIALWANLIPFLALAQEHGVKMVLDFAEPVGARWYLVNHGVMVMPDGVTVAFIENLTTKTNRYYRRGARFDGLEIVRIGKQGVEIMAADGRRQTLEVGAEPKEFAGAPHAD